MYIWVNKGNNKITELRTILQRESHLISIRLYFILTILITEDDHNQSSR
jgi:hypothetical protein